MAKKEKSSRESLTNKGKYSRESLTNKVEANPLQVDSTKVIIDKPKAKVEPFSSSIYSRAPTAKEKHFRKTFNREFRDLIDFGDVFQISDDEFGRYEGFARGRTPGDLNVIYINYSSINKDYQTAASFPESTNIDGKDYVIKYRKV